MENADKSQLFKSHLTLFSGLDLNSADLNIYPRWVEIFCGSKKLAFSLVDKFAIVAGVCRQWQLDFAKIFPPIPSSQSEKEKVKCFVIPQTWHNKPFECLRERNSMSNIQTSQTPLILSPYLEIGELRLTKGLYDALGFFMENGEQRGGVVRLPDERQVAMAAASVAMLDGESLEEVVRLKREEYWHREDLLEMRRAQMGLEPNNPQSTMEFRYRVRHLRSPRWDLVVTNYRLVSDEIGGLYQVCKNVAFESIPTPEGYESR